MDSPARACDPAGMLVELAVRDLALLERATLTFGTGLNVITGETGAGKSLLPVSYTHLTLPTNREV